MLPEYVTVDQMMDAREALERILGLTLHPVVIHRLARITKFLDEEKSFFLAVRDPLVRKYGEVDPTNPEAHSVTPAMAGWPRYVEAISDVMSEKVFFPFAKLNMGDLPSLSPKEYMKLWFMLEDGEEVIEAEDAALKARAEERKKRLPLEKDEAALLEQPTDSPIAKWLSFPD